MTERVVAGRFQWQRFQQRLKLDQYTSWACDLSDVHLGGLFWFVGEFRARGHCLMKLFERHPGVFTARSTDAARANVTLECLLHPERCDAEEVRRWLAGDGEERAPMFSLASRKELDLGKYTRWASELSEAGLGGMLWLIGTVGLEIVPLLKPASAYLEISPWPDFNELRPRVALEGIFRIVVRGERFNTDQVCEFLLSGVRQWHRDCAAAVPFTVRRAVRKAVPETARGCLKHCDRLEEGYRFWGEDDQRRGFTVTVSHGDERVTVRKMMSEEEVPAPVMAALKARAPEVSAKPIIWASGPTWHWVERYRFVWLQAGSPEIVVSADGSKVTVKES